MEASETRTFWLSEASKVRRRVNFGWWVERFNWISFVLALFLAASLLLIRTKELEWWQGERWLLFAGALVVLSAIVSWLWSRSRFLRTRDAMIRIDDQCALHGQLISASEGVAEWPPKRPQAAQESLPGWRSGPALIPLFFAIAIVALSWWLPLPERGVTAPEISSEPKAWEEMEEWAETINAEDLIEPESLEEIVKQVNELRDQPEESWFSHSSLEATDTLQESFNRDIQGMSQDLATLERSLEALRTFSGELSEEGREMLIREFSEALESLGENGLSINEALAEQLGELDPAALDAATIGSLTKEQLEQLQKQLREGSEALGSLEGLKSLPGEGEMASGRGMGFMMPNGEVGRGRNDAPLFFGDEDDLKTNRIEAVSNEDLARARLGDVLGLGETEHEENPEAVAIQEGGLIESGGSGGDAVWKETLNPEEQAILKRYFD